MHDYVCMEPLPKHSFSHLYLKVLTVAPVVALIELLCLYQVDEQMRRELAEWKLAVDKDKGGKTKANAKVLK